MDFMQGYEEWKKKQQEQGETPQESTSSFEQGYQAWKEKNGENLTTMDNGFKWVWQGKNLDGALNKIHSETQDYLNRQNTLVGLYNLRFKGRTGTYEDSYVDDAADWLEGISQYSSSMDGRASHIRDMIEEYRGYMDEEQVAQYDEWAAPYLRALDETGSYPAQVLQAAQADRDYWAQFESEEAYGEWQTAQRDYETMASFDLEAGQKEIDELKAKKKTRTKEFEAADVVTGTEEGNQANHAYLRDIEEYDKLISEKEKYLTQAERLQADIRLAAVADPESEHYDPEFEKYSRFDSSIQDPMYLMVNAPEESGILDWMGMGHMDENQVALYNYYYSKHGADAAQHYYDSLEESLNYRKAEKRFQNMKGNTFKELLFGIEAGLDQFESGVEGFLNNLTGNDEYVPASSTQMLAGMVREDLADNSFNMWYNFKTGEWEDRIFGASAGQAAYDTISTTANMAPSMLVSAVTKSPLLGSLTLGVPASGNAYQEMINQGYSKEQARTYSTLVGASETALQYALGGISSVGGKLSGKAVSGLIGNVDNVIARTALKLGGNMLSEFTEESLQEVLTPWFKSLVTGEAYQVSSTDVLYSGFLGALSAGFLEGPSTVKGAWNTYSTGRKLQKAGVTPQTLAEIGSKFSADSVAYQLAGKVSEKTGAYDMGRLFHEMGAEMTQQNQADIAQYLEEQGVLPKDAQTLAKVMAEVVAGRPLTRKQQKLMNANEDLTAAMILRVIEPNSTVYQRNQGYEEVLRTLAQHKAGVSTKAEVQTAPEQETATEKVTDGEDIPGEPQDAARGGYEVSAEGKTIRRDTGETVTIREIVSIRDGKMTLRLEDGSTVDAEDLAYGSSDEAVIYETVARMGIRAAAANVLVNAYHPGSGISAAVYAHGIEEAYRYGIYNMPMAELAEGVFASSLTQRQREVAYRLGQMFGGKNTAKEQAAVSKKEKTADRQGKVYFDKGNMEISDFRKHAAENGIKLNLVQETAVRVMEKLAAALGIDFHVFQSYEKDGKRYYIDNTGEEKAAPDGKYYSNGKIYIDLNAGNTGKGTMLFTVAHELTHFIRQWSPAKFKVLANFLMKQYGQKGVRVDDLISAQIAKAKREGRTIDRDAAYEEVVADSMETMLNDGNVVQRIAEMKKQDRNLWQKICDWFKNLADDLKATVEAYKGHSPNSAEGRMVAEMQDVIGIFESLYADALMDASGNYQASGAEKNTAVEDGVRYSLGGRSAQKNITNDYQKTVDSILNGTRRDSSAVLLGYTPDVYQNLGMPSLPFVIGPGHVYSAAKTEAEAKLENRYSKKMHYHGLGDTAVKNIYQAAENPLMIIAAKDVDPKATPMRSTHSVVAIVDVGTNDKHLLLPVEITAKRTVNGEEMDVNVLSSAYTRNVQTLVQEAIALETIGEVGVYYIKKGATLPADSGVQFPVHLSKKAASGGIIHSFAEKVNLNIVDQTQSRQFKRWFGDWQNRPETASKVINADGTPRVMYHGSPEQFTIFDKRKAKSSGMFGKGFYFTDSESHASTYGNRYEVYLNIRNPLEHGRSTVSRPQVRKFLEAVAENEDYSIENYGTYDVDAVLEKVLGDKSKSDAFQVLQDINATAIGDFVEAVELFNDIAGTSFDGIVAPTETVAFYPEQIKSVTDNIGTFDGTNPDIRYSSRDPVAAEVDKALQQENAKLREDVTYLKELLKLQRSVTGGTKFTKTSVEAAAGQLMKAASAKGDRKALAGLLNSFYEYIAKEKELTWEGVSEAAQPTVDWLQKHVDLKPQRSEYAQEILGQLRGSRIYLDESQKAEAAHRYGSFNDFRKSLMGSVTIANDARTSLDSLWQEMAALYPDVFDGEITAADMPSALAEAIDTLRSSDTSVLEYAYHRDMIAQDLLRQVYESYWKVSTLYTVADVKQREINRIKGEHSRRMASLREYHREKTAQLKQQHREDLARVRQEYREKAEKKQQEIIDRYQESRKRGVENRNRTAMRHKIRGVVNELNQYLLRGTKERHVPIELQKAVAEALDAVNMDTVGAEERIRKLEEALLKAKTPEKIQEISRKIDNIRKMGDNMNARLKALKDAYDGFVNSDDPLIANSHDEVISGKLEKVINDIGNTPLRDMTLSQLEDVYDMYRMVLTTVRNANKAFKQAKSETIAALGGKVMGEVRKVGGSTKQRLKGMEGISSFAWNALKPVYAFETIGSDTLKKIFDSVRAGEDTWARDVSEARVFYLKKYRQYGYSSWDFDKRHSFTSTSGMDFDLSLDQIMSLYAYSKRAQAADHLRYGGIVFDESTRIVKKTKAGISLEFNPTEATAYNISYETLNHIIAKLSKDQRAFVDDMQDYLSTVMGNKGNEVSLEMYGIKLFKEKHYFPLKSATQFMAKAKEQQEQTGKIKNAGFSKETVPKAKNPVVLTPFMDVWADHVNDMSMYHAFVLPMEDFYRVYNYGTRASEDTAEKSVEMVIQNAYGKGATKYIDQLLKDLNGGARVDNTTGIINKSIGLFKKGAVFASLSVVIQQPSAIARAMALVDAKYFIGHKVDSKRHKALWEEVKKYAPVAIIKEMGYFDTHMGKSTRDFITSAEYSGVSEKMKALVKDGGYRDEVLSKAPALADEMAWCGIWQAVKREIRAKHPGLEAGSEAFLKIAGQRFTEVITKTQVYDSVLSRSAMMRSKDTGMKMATSFMAEPTTSLNMVANAIIQGKRGNKKYARAAIGSVIASQILNSILVSFVYAARDDDEDETYLEKYMGSLTGELFDSMNPATYIPFVKDIVSIMQGYDVERSDMAIISDLWNAWQKLGREDVPVYRQIEEFGGSLAQIFGLPVKNVMRDIRAVYQTVDSALNGQETTWAGAMYAAKSGVPEWLGGGDTSKQQKLYDAYLSEDKAQIARMEAQYKDQSAIHSAVRKALRENDSRIQDAAKARYNGDISEYTRIAEEIIGEGNFSRDDVVAAVNAEINVLEKAGAEQAAAGVSTGSTKEGSLYKVDDCIAAFLNGDKSAAKTVREDIIAAAVSAGKTAEDAEKSFRSSFRSGLQDAYAKGEIAKADALEMLIEYGGMEEEEASGRVRYWEFKQEYPEYSDLSESKVGDYYTFCEPVNISVDVYCDYLQLVAACDGEDKNGDGRADSGTVKKEILAAINSMEGLSYQQKKALREMEGY